MAGISSVEMIDVALRKAGGYFSKFLGRNTAAAKDLISSQVNMSNATLIDLVRAFRRECPSSLWSQGLREVKNRPDIANLGITQKIEYLLKENFGVTSASELIAKGKCKSDQTVASFIRSKIFHK